MAEAPVIASRRDPSEQKAALHHEHASCLSAPSYHTAAAPCTLLVSNDVLRTLERQNQSTSAALLRGSMHHAQCHEQPFPRYGKLLKYHSAHKPWWRQSRPQGSLSGPQTKVLAMNDVCVTQDEVLSHSSHAHHGHADNAPSKVTPDLGLARVRGHKPDLRHHECAHHGLLGTLHAHAVINDRPS